MNIPGARPNTLATVSVAFIEDWLLALDSYYPAKEKQSLLQRAGINISRYNTNQRVTLDQIVRLYQIAAIETNDEMMGLWSRPVRARALQHLLTTVREANTLHSALYRFSTFWNLLLDDYQFNLQQQDGTVELGLLPQEQSRIQRFGHMLILKLAHGLVSWLAGYEVPVKEVQFAFECPGFSEDYHVIYPAPVIFGAPHSSISFEIVDLGPPRNRNPMELNLFLKRAPRDWLFTSLWEHTLSLRIRELIYRSDWNDCTLVDAADTLAVTPRTLMRRLEADGTSFQSIKDKLRRDIAIRDLQQGEKSIEEISQDVGFSSAANFHRAFKRWTGVTPSSYRPPCGT